MTNGQRSRIDHWIRHKRLQRIDEEIKRLKTEYHVGMFTNPEAMLIHMERLHELWNARQTVLGGPDREGDGS
jgi:hypothetical protein